MSLETTGVPTPRLTGAPVVGLKAARRVPTKIVAATLAGNTIEYYDFITYSFFAVYIGKTFFPLSTPFISLLLSIGVFGVGFIFRPVGGMLIGAYADRAGRKPAMLLTISLITVGTMGLALTPSYATIGIAAPIIVVLCRLVQGLALGGEIGPASAFLIEIAPSHQRGLYLSWQIACQGMAAFFAGALGVSMSLLLSPDALAAWGWRVPFLLGLTLIPVAILLRRSMPETLGHQAASSEPRARLRDHFRVLSLAVFIILGGTVAAYVGLYMTTYAITVLQLRPSVALAATMAGGATIFVFALIGGWLADRYGRRRVVLTVRILLAVVSYPLFLLLSTYPNAATLLFATVVLNALSAISTAAFIVVIPELLPRSIRATGLAIAYAIGVSVFGGSTQFVVTYLIGVTGEATSPAWYVALACIISAIAIWALPETRGRALQE